MLAGEPDEVVPQRLELAAGRVALGCEPLLERGVALDRDAHQADEVARRGGLPRIRVQLQEPVGEARESL